jgi:hypothetical protein
MGDALEIHPPEQRLQTRQFDPAIPRKSRLFAFDADLKNPSVMPVRYGIQGPVSPGQTGQLGIGWSINEIRFLQVKRLHRAAAERRHGAREEKNQKGSQEPGHGSRLQSGSKAPFPPSFFEKRLPPSAFSGERRIRSGKDAGFS